MEEIFANYHAYRVAKQAGDTDEDGAQARRSRHWPPSNGVSLPRCAAIRARMSNGEAFWPLLQGVLAGRPRDRRRLPA